MVNLGEFVRGMLESFWLSVSAGRTPLREKILYWLLVGKMGLEAVGRLCEAVVVGLARVVTQGGRDRVVDVFARPRLYLD